MGRVTAKIVNRFVEIIPSEETYFLSVERPSFKVNREVIQLNYATLSPFKKTEIIYYPDKEKLYLWFIPEGWRSKKISIPEGFLLYRSYNGDKDAILIKEGDKKITFVVIKDHNLVTELIKEKETDIAQFIELLKREYSLVSAEVIKINEPVTIKFVGIKDVISFAPALNVSPNVILRKALEGAKVPFIVFLLLLNVGDLGTYVYYNRVLNRENAKLFALRKQNASLKKEFKTLEKQKNFWVNFEKNVLKYPDTFHVLNALTCEVLKHHGKINMYHQNGNLISIWVVSDSSSTLVEGLMKGGCFKNIKILNIIQDQKDKTKEIARLEMRLKEKP